MRWDDEVRARTGRRLLQVSDQGDQTALLQFKQGVQDPAGILHSWNLTLNPDVCDWGGVTCTNGTNPRVVHLYLTGMCADGIDWSHVWSWSSEIKLESEEWSMCWLCRCRQIQRKFEGRNLAEHLGAHRAAKPDAVESLFTRKHSRRAGDPLHVGWSQSVRE